MSFQCPLCTRKTPLYKCPVCGASAHINLETKTVTIHAPTLDPKLLRKNVPISMCVPSHFDCELAKPISVINLDKLVKVIP